MNRITSLEQTGMEVLLSLADGNPGAVSVMAKVIKHMPEVDPTAWHPWLPIFMLDQYEIYGPDIWVLFKDVCGKEIVYFLAFLRAKQLGLIPLEELKNAISKGHIEQSRLEEIHAMVEERIGAFGRKVEKEACQ